MHPYRHVLAATDFSEHSEAAARRAAELARRFDAGLTLLHVVEFFPEDLPTDWIGPEDVDPQAYLEQRSEQALTALATRLGVDQARLEVLYSQRAAKYEIIHFAEQANVDLIVVGSHGSHGLAALLGSTADGLINRSSCDVLVVRAGA